jgi:hypothetical protein
MLEHVQARRECRFAAELRSASAKRPPRSGTRSRARSRAPDNHRPRQVFSLAGSMRLGSLTYWPPHSFPRYFRAIRERGRTYTKGDGEPSSWSLTVMARTTKIPQKVSRNKSGTPIVGASKLFAGRPKRTTREAFFDTEKQARIFADALNLAAVRDGDWRWLKGESTTDEPASTSRGITPPRGRFRCVSPPPPGAQLHRAGTGAPCNRQLLDQRGTRPPHRPLASPPIDSRHR